jgi:hypothetical protein
MALTKHKLFLIPIKDGNINLGEKVLESISAFLADENIIYVNHSVTTISKNDYTSDVYPKEKNNPQMDVFFKYKYINTFCVISLVYKDLKNTNEDVTSLSKKLKHVVRETVESGKKIPKPQLIKP